MSNYHTLSASDDGGKILVAFHIVVPNEINAVGINFQTALVEDTSISKVSEIPWVEAAEQTQLSNGELYEYITTIATHKNVSNLQKRNIMDNKYSLLVLVVQDKIRQRYLYWHFNRDVV